MELTPFNVIALIISIFGGLSCFSKPSRCIILLFGVATLFNPSIRVGFLAIYLNSGLIYLWLFSILYRILSDRTIEFISTSLDRPILVLLGIATISTLWFGGETQSIKRLIAFSLFVVAFFATTYFISNKEDNFRFLTRWIGVGGGLAGITGFIYLVFFPFRNEAGRSAGAFGNPNALANVLLIAIPFTFASLLNDKNFRTRILWAASLAIGFLGLFSAKSRGAIMALLAYPFAITTIIPRKSAFFLLLIVTIFLSGNFQMALSGYQSSYFIQLFTYVISTSDLYNREKHFLATENASQESYSEVQWSRLGQFENLPNSLGARMMIWGQAIEAFWQYPLFGVGLGRGFFSGVPYDCKTFNGAFCLPLTIATEMGLLGLIFYLLIVYKSSQLILEGYRTAVTEEQKIYVAAIIAAFVSFHIHSTVEDFLFAIMCNWMYGILTGLIAVAPMVFAENNINECINELP